MSLPSLSRTTFSQGYQELGFCLWQLALAHDFIQIGTQFNHLGSTAVEPALWILHGQLLLAIADLLHRSFHSLQALPHANGAGMKLHHLFAQAFKLPLQSGHVRLGLLLTALAS